MRERYRLRGVPIVDDITKGKTEATQRQLTFCLAPPARPPLLRPRPSLPDSTRPLLIWLPHAFEGQSLCEAYRGQPFERAIDCDDGDDAAKLIRAELSSWPLCASWLTCISK